MFAKHLWCHDCQYCDIYRLEMMSLRAASVSLARLGFDKSLALLQCVDFPFFACIEIDE